MKMNFVLTIKTEKNPEIKKKIKPGTCGNGMVAKFTGKQRSAINKQI